MFGYVRHYKPHMRVCEYESYKSVYCALCKQMGKEYGFLSRFTLNYDFTFLALLGLAADEDECSFEKKSCVCNPLKKCIYCVSRSDVLSYSSAISMLTLYHKLCDNVADSSFFKSLVPRFLLMLFSGKAKKAARLYPVQADVFEQCMKKQRELEDEKCPSIDKAADPTALMLSSAFEFYAKDESSRRILKRLGYCLGRWVYLADAADDLKDDIDKGNYNPFVLAWGIRSENDIKSFGSRLSEVLDMCISEVNVAFNLLDVQRFTPIIENIIREGMPSVQKTVIFGKEAKNERSV